MNNIQLLGRITKDLEPKTTTSGMSVCSFDIAVTRKFNKEITDCSGLCDKAVTDTVVGKTANGMPVDSFSANQDGNSRRTA